MKLTSLISDARIIRNDKISLVLHIERSKQNNNVFDRKKLF